MPIDRDKLLRMAEQIAANMRYTDDEEIVAAKTADHINRFWEPGMRAELLDYAASDACPMSPALAATVKHIKPA